MAGAPGGHYRALHRDDNIAKTFALEHLLDIEMRLAKMRLERAFSPSGLKNFRQTKPGK